MALSGLEIYKLLPQTNCKECGFPTCLAFAMKLAQKGTELSKCPYVTDETRAALDAAAAPPIRLVTVGSGERAFAVIRAASERLVAMAPMATRWLSGTPLGLRRSTRI